MLLARTLDIDRRPLQMRQLARGQRRADGARDRDEHANIITACEPQPSRRRKR
jgi:hypothetical protein